MIGKEPNRLVTVIMPVRNEGGFIERSIGAVLAQDWPADRLEVIVADGMSTDGTREVLEKMAEVHSNLRIIDNPAGIVAPGLNRAIAAASGEIVIRVDGHTTIETNYVSSCVEALDRTEAANVGGRMRATGSGRFARAVAAGTSHPFGVGGGRFHWSQVEEWVDTTYLGCWSRATLDEVGPFDEELVRNQDDELNYRLRSIGGRILLSPSVRSTYFCRSTVGGLFRQYFQYGMWKVRVMQKHPRQMQPRQFVPALFVLALLGAFGAAVVAPIFWIAFAVVAGSYVVTNVAASIAVAARRGWSMVGVLPLVFATLHLSYGAGFLWGLVRFAGRWRDRTTLLDGERVMAGGAG